VKGETEYRNLLCRASQEGNDLFFPERPGQTLHLEITLGSKELETSRHSPYVSYDCWWSYENREVSRNQGIAASGSRELNPLIEEEHWANCLDEEEEITASSSSQLLPAWIVGRVSSLFPSVYASLNNSCSWSPEICWILIHWCDISVPIYIFFMRSTWSSSQMFPLSSTSSRNLERHSPCILVAIKSNVEDKRCGGIITVIHDFKVS